MAYEITTPLLIAAASAAQAVIEGLQNNTMEPRIAREMTAAAGKLISATREDVNARLNASKIRAMEARLIEASAHAPGATPAALETGKQAVGRQSLDGRSAAARQAAKRSKN